jgi:uncharacterized ParB-like nuclease family protein
MYTNINCVIECERMMIGWRAGIVGRVLIGQLLTGRVDALVHVVGVVVDSPFTSATSGCHRWQQCDEGGCRQGAICLLLNAASTGHIPASGLCV